MIIPLNGSPVNTVYRQMLHAKAERPESTNPRKRERERELSCLVQRVKTRYGSFVSAVNESRPGEVPPHGDDFLGTAQVLALGQHTSPM